MIARAVLRSFAVAALAVFIAAAAFVADAQWHCEYDARRVQPRRDATGIVLDQGFAIARPDEVVLVCSSKHCIGPLCHDDLSCYCVPDHAVDQVNQRLGPESRCTRDRGTACPQSHCREHL